MDMLKNRHTLREKHSKTLKSKIEEIYGCRLPEDLKVEMAKLFDFDVILINNSADFLLLDDKPLFTLPSIDRYNPRKKFVTVDKGAVKFVSNGADIMVPGIVDLDNEIKKDDPVWVKEENYGKAIAVGISMMDGEDLIKTDRGKGIKNIHWVGDKIWRFISKSL